MAESNKQRSARVEEVEAELSAADYNNCNSNGWTGDKNTRTRLSVKQYFEHLRIINIFDSFYLFIYF